ncbi:MAG: DUF4843 domain-containing protein [Candidatus Pedobacter colombiensis]|uniref:DUF4843 domain-containing protein n=1 Tax=Candidatus Pedobacter colombiensis TaxID=3121371 RepID=A0AAJ5WAA1_9SPHI|nr:DUF4843 domain-containing protein [Pedobacter sp.]WEK20218.1 MAG: DUF4843 domain-containing protein [Pedobacter sp.]
MKRNKAIFNLSLFLLLLLGACKKEQLKIYEDKSPSLYGLSGYSYSFIEDLTAQTKTIYLTVRLSGELKNYDRNFKIETVFDSTTTAKPEWFEIKEGVLPKNSTEGRVAIVLKRNKTVDTSLVNLTVRLLPSNELGTMLGTMSKVTWTAKIIQPVNWSWMRYYLGADFSTGWYQFVMQVTGRTSFPYYPTLASSDPVTWWMSAGEIQAWGLKVKEALIEYNLQHPNDPFIHNDGPKKGLPVVFY